MVALYGRLLTIDNLTRPDHTFIEPDDICYYMGEYTARGGFSASDTNDLILNLKKPMDRRGNPEWRYKAWAMVTVARDLRAILGQRQIENVTFVPVPPSKAKNDAAYDPRLVQILTRMAKGFDGDVRELIHQHVSMAASHESDQRPEIPELIANYYIDEAVAHSPRENIVIFDDMLTTGRHFKAVQAVLSERYPEAQFYGLFVARRLPKSDDVGILF